MPWAARIISPNARAFAPLTRDVANLLKSLTSPDLGWFILVEYEDEKGQMRPSYDLTKDGFTMLALKWTGPKWVAAQVAYIQRFNAMEAALLDANRAASRDAIKIKRPWGPLDQSIAACRTRSLSGPFRFEVFRER